MSHQNPFDNDNNQFELSYELLFLLKWIVEHEQETLKKIVDRAVNNGFKDQLVQAHDLVDMHVSEALQHSIIDFLDLIDSLLHDAINENSVKKVLQRNLVPAIDRIDTSVCDKATVQGSIDRASARLEIHPDENPKEILFKELLKRWKPRKKSILN